MIGSRYCTRKAHAPFLLELLRWRAVRDPGRGSRRNFLRGQEVDENYPKTAQTRAHHRTRRIARVPGTQEPRQNARVPLRRRETHFFGLLPPGVCTPETRPRPRTRFRCSAYTTFAETLRHVDRQAGFLHFLKSSFAVRFARGARDIAARDVTAGIWPAPENNPHEKLCVK